MLGSDKEKVEPGGGSALKMASRLFDEGHRRLRLIVRPPKGCLHQCRTHQLAPSKALHLFFSLIFTYLLFIYCLFIVYFSFLSWP